MLWSEKQRATHIVTPNDHTSLFSDHLCSFNTSGGLHRIGMGSVWLGDEVIGLPRSRARPKSDTCTGTQGHREKGHGWGDDAVGRLPGSRAR